MTTQSWEAQLKAIKLRGDVTFAETFTENDFQSNDGMQSAIFGPAFWMTIHMASFNYPTSPTPEQKRNYENWLCATGKILPCRYCRENFEKNMTDAGFGPQVFENRDTFSRFCYTLHDKVNQMLGKSSPTFEEVRSNYEILRARCLSEKEKEAFAKENKEAGCIRPKHRGPRSRCIINVLPMNKCDGSSINIDASCGATQS